MTQYKISSRFSRLISAAVLCAGISSCVYINQELGSGFIPTDQRYDIKIDTVAISRIDMKYASKLSGYNSSRFTVGSITDSEGRTTTRSCAFTMIPAGKYDFGKGGTVERFHFAAAKDTLSYIDKGQIPIIQNIKVYSLKEKIREDQLYIGTELKKEDMIARTIYTGGDSLSFDFDNSWATEKFLKKLQGMEKSSYDSIGAFTEKVFPGIYLESDAPQSEGGRINMFKIQIGADLKNYTLSGGYATLRIKGAEFGGRTVEDTTFMFLYGATDFSITQEATDYYSGETLTPQFALNMSPSGDDSTVPGGRDIIIEGAGGLKPVISAESLRKSFESALEARNDKEGTKTTLSDVVINKATLVLPVKKEKNQDYSKFDLYPPVIGATCRLESKDEKKLVSYAGITDASSSSENPGELDRSTLRYMPDISYHFQQIISLDENDSEFGKKIAEKDIWFLTMAKEVQQQEQEGNSEYYQNLQYSAYYNNLYNYGGYGGYGGYYGGYGYGGYGGYGYNNYYDYTTMAMLYSMQGQQNQQQVETKIVLDRDRYYRGILEGTDSGEPKMIVTYSVRHRPDKQK